jgi:hypothetical protein
MPVLKNGRHFYSMATQRSKTPSLSISYFFLLPVFVLAALGAQAQLTKEQRVQDSVIGWDPKKVFDHYLKPQTTPAGKQKQAYVDKMVEWVAKSYTPVGSLGEYTRYINNNGFGLTLSTWNVGYDYLDAQKHFRPIPEENVPYHFVANRVFGSWAIDFLNKNGEVFFAMQPNRYVANATSKQQREGMDKTVHPNAAQYITWINEWVTIYLAPNNKMPMIPVTRGELLDKAAAGLDSVYAESDAYVRKEVDKYRANIVKLKEKYKSSLNEPALVVDMQPNWRSFSADTWDVFKGGPNTTYYPVYKFDAATLARMKGTQPLWLAIALPYATKTDGNAEYELYTAMTENLNYEYIYNYFFDAEKVKGKTYVPANEASLKARLDAYRKKNMAHINAVADTKAWGTNVHFRDDFSNAANGGEPVNWNFSRTSEHDQVVTIEKYPGKWLKLGYNNPTYPTLLKKPLPTNFTLEFDVITADFNGRYGGGIQLYLTTNQVSPTGIEKNSPKAATIEINLNAGNEADYASNYSGVIRATLHKAPEVNSEHYKGGAYGKSDLRAFTNKKDMIHVSLRVNNGTTTISINDQVLLASKDWLLAYDGKCADCTVPADLHFNHVYWKASQSETTSYIGNIRLMKQ